MRRWIPLVLALWLLVSVADGRALGDSPPYGRDFLEQLCAPDPIFRLSDGDRLIPILTYHFVGRSTLERDGRSVSRFNATAADFEAQLLLLHQLGYHPVTVGEIAAALDGQATLPNRPIALTFDDGWREHYDVVFPLLQKYGMRATFFIVTAYIGYPRFMTWEELAELRDAGMEIASHGHKHLSLVDENDKNAWREIALSKQAIEEQIGVPVVSFAYPFGGYRQGLSGMLQRAGYSVAVGTGGSPVQKAGNRYYLRRIEVRGQDTLLTFMKRLPWHGAGTPLCPPPATPAPRGRIGPED